MVFAVFAISTSNTVWSTQLKDNNNSVVINDSIINPLVEPAYSGWQFYLDNDLLSGASNDRDYTGGIAYTLSGKKVRDYWIGLSAIDSLTGMARLHAQKPAISKHSIELGLSLFTPQNIVRSDPIPDDHPYANLLFVANTRQTILPKTSLLYQSALAVGFLGLPVGEWFHSAAHSSVDGTEPQGWDNQISEGGEPTFRYSIGLQKSLTTSQSTQYGFDLLGGLEASVGFSSDVGASLSFRWGKIYSSWWTFTPHQSDYISLGSTQSLLSSTNMESEFFLWGGVSAKFRFYNSILQGQFRDSAVTFDSDELHHLVEEGWIGISYRRVDGWGMSFVIRARTQEIDKPDSNSPVWGSLILSHSF